MRRVLPVIVLLLPFVGCGTPAPHSDEVAAAASSNPIVCDQTGCISLTQLSANIVSKLQGLVTGYEVLVGLVPPATGGWARTSTDAWPGGVPMSTSIPTNVASLSKVLTTVAVLQSLARNHISLDAKISTYLWPAWKQSMGPNIGTLTFRDLLTHKSGFRDSDKWCCPNDTSCNKPATTGAGFVDCGSDASFGNLQALIKNGVNLSDKSSSCYENCNFAIFRELLPFMEGATYPGLPDDADRAKWSATYYIDYMNQNVFAPVGVGTRSCAPGGNDMLSYPFPSGSTAGEDWGDWTLTCGGGGWYLSADDLFKVVTDLASGTKLLTAAQKQQMNGINGAKPDGSNTLGWDNTVQRDCPAPGLCKNGDLHDGKVSIWTYAGITKCNVPVVAIVNSPVPPAYQPTDANKNLTDIIGIVSDAEKASSAPGTPRCCDGSTACNGACCAAGQICNSQQKCAVCGGSGQSCAANADCCSNNCSNGQCYCASVGMACVDDSGCCSQQCTAGTCACLPLGAVCPDEAAVCCGSNVCIKGVCALPGSGGGTSCGLHPPPFKCSAGWHCCGGDGWECGVCP